MPVGVGGVRNIVHCSLRVKAENRGIIRSKTSRRLLVSSWLGYRNMLSPSALVKLNKLNWTADRSNIVGLNSWVVGWRPSTLLLLYYKYTSQRVFYESVTQSTYLEGDGLRENWVHRLAPLLPVHHYPSAELHCWCLVYFIFIHFEVNTLVISNEMVFTDWLVKGISTRRNLQIWAHSIISFGNMSWIRRFK